MELNIEKKLLIEMVMRQTNYSYEECEQKLHEMNYDYLKVIKNFYNIKEKSEKNITINQGIIKEIRNFMDTNVSNNLKIKNIEKKENNIKQITKLDKIEE